MTLPLRLGTVALTLAAACMAGAHAADAQALQRASQRLAQAAAPWCGRWADLDAQGVRRCVLPVRTVAAEGLVNAFNLLGSTLLTERIVAGLDEPALALVLGHEIAHFVLGHGQQRLQAAGTLGAPLLAVMQDLSPAPHPQTPAAPQQQELDADALGLVFAGLAGYPLASAASLWRRLPALGQSAAAASSHPSSADRAAHAAAGAAAFCAVLRQGAAAMPAPERLLPEADYRRDEIALQQQRLDAGAVCAGVAAAPPSGANP